jgi:hypothetical protein
VDEDALEAQQEVIDRIQAEEAARILADLIGVQGSDPRLIQRPRPRRCAIDR